MKKPKAPARPRLATTPEEREQVSRRLAADYPGVPERVIDAAVVEGARTVGMYGQGLDERRLLEVIARHHLDAAVALQAHSEKAMPIFGSGPVSRRGANET